MSTCAGVERWLDEGRPEAEAAAMSAHAAGCARCGRAVAAAMELEAALAAPPAGAAPTGFTDAVMARALASRPAAAGVRTATAAPSRPPRPAWRVALPWLPALALCVAGAGWAATLAWEALAALPASAAGALEGLAVPAAARGAAALEAGVEAWLRDLATLPPARQALVSLVLAAAATGAAWWLVRRVEVGALRRTRA